MADRVQPPILVTGAHRTGTTWVGKMLAASAGITYVSEPLNLWHRPGVLNVPVHYWYTYICTSNQDSYLPGLNDTLDFTYHTRAEITALRSLKDFLRMGRDWRNFLFGRVRKQRPLLKDPFAVFSALWFAETLGCHVVVTVRHPAAFASSLKRLNWPFDFNNLLEQPLLIQDWLSPFRNEMETQLHNPGDVIAQSSLLWRMIYYVVARFREQQPNLHLVRHEDLSLDPVKGYRDLYVILGLEFTTRVQRVITHASSVKNPVELSKHTAHAVSLNSRANLKNWKRRLEDDEIHRIRRLTEDVASTYYDDQDWE